MLGSTYGYLDGTSMATPHVAGVLALVMSRLPELTWQQARTRVVDHFDIERIADRYVAYYADLMTGIGTGRRV